MSAPFRRCALFVVLACSLAPAASFAESFTLERCITRALAHHPDLRAGTLELAAAESRLRAAGALDAPSLSWSVGKLGSALGNADRDESLRLSQDVPLFGQRAGRRGVARVERDRAAADREVTQLRLRGEVTRAYRRLQADSLTLRTVRQLTTTARDLEQMVGIRLRTGGARYLDVLRARAERARYENDAIEAERAVREDRRTLNALMSRDADAPLEAADTLAFAPLAVPFDSVLSRARRDRPGLAATRLALAREQAQVALVRREAWPSLSASVGLDRVPGASGPGFGGEVGVTLPFAPWSDRRARIDESVAARGAAEARLQSAERSLAATLRGAYESARAAEAQVQRFEGLLLADGRDAIRAAIQNYQAGQIEGLELFETLRTLRTIQLEHVRVLLDYELALADLEVAE